MYCDLKHTPALQPLRRIVYFCVTYMYLVHLNIPGGQMGEHAFPLTGLLLLGRLKLHKFCFAFSIVARLETSKNTQVYLFY